MIDISFEAFVYLTMIRDYEFGVVSVVVTPPMSEDDEACLLDSLGQAGMKEFAWWGDDPKLQPEVLKERYPQVSLVRVIKDLPRLSWACQDCGYSMLRVYGGEVASHPECFKCQSLMEPKISIPHGLMVQ